MDRAVVVGLVNNTALLLALVLLYDTFAKSGREGKSLRLQLVTGLILGGIAVAIMANPVQWSPGVIFDTRTVLLGTAGLFFPPLSSVPAVLLAAYYRFHLGGAGAPMGIATILSSGVAGIAWRRWRRDREDHFSAGELYAFGLVVHALMIGSMGLLPRGIVVKTMGTVGVPVMLLYPVATTLLGGLLGRRAARLRTEAALRESEARYRSLFDLAPDGVVLVDPETASFVDFNDQACRQLGYTREEFGRLRLSDVELAETREEGRDTPAGDADDGHRELETLHRTRDGETRHVQVSARFSTVGDRRLDHCIWRDVSSRRRTEQLLKTRLDLVQYSLSHTMDELLTETLDRVEDLTGSRIGFFHFVQDDLRTVALHAWSTRTSRDFCWAEGTGTHYAIDRAGVWVDCFHQRRPVIHNDYASLAHRKGMPPGHAAVVRELTVPIIRSDRVVAILGIGNKATAYTDEDISLVSSLADLVWDVAERKAAQDALRESDEKFAAAFDRAPVMISISQIEDGMFLDVNEKFVDISGFSREEVLGRTSVELGWVDTADRERLVELTEREGKVQDFELRVHTKAGEERVCRYWLEPITLAGHRRLLAVALDVTEHRRMEQQLRQAQKMEAVGTLAGGIAHDFNNILTPVMAYAELALMQLEDGHPVRADVADLLAAAERARDLVRQILVISRKEAEEPLTPIPLGPLVNETTKFLRASLPANITLCTDLDPACGPVLGDLSQLHQVLLNLCTNAGHAMGEKGGVLTVSLHRQETRDGGRRVRLAVRDTGTGIPKETLGRIFEPYFTTKAAGKGSGLGLAVCHGIVTKLGGEIRVESKLGAGTTFEVLLPETSRAETVASDAPCEAPTGEGQRVLVVDDEPAVRDVVQRLLSALRYEVTVAADAAQGLEAFRATPEEFDAVLTDYTMPGMNGLALAGEVLKLRPGLAVLLGTGFAEAVSQEVVVDCGLRGLVMKPYTAHKLGEALRRALHDDAGGPRGG
ncbi:MAG: PAS domain S-box protein [Deltaproteobacteria bacterium]|nr:PAS domain S-box protein [Deltaproteobacteria bacterium]